MIQQQHSPDVIVVGAGPSGLTMACELLRRGVTCRIFERAATPASTSRAIGLQARSLEVFANMGIADAVLQRGIKSITINAYADNRLAFRLQGGFVGDDSIPYSGAIIQQQITEQILRDLLHKLGGHVEYSQEVQSFRQASDHVIVSVKNLTDESIEEITAYWLIGCDGAHSRVRKQAGIAFEGSTYPEEFLLADLDLDWERSHDAVYVWMHQDGQFAAMPLPDNRWRLMVDLSGTDGKAVPAASLELFQRLLQERTGDRQTVLSNPIWMSNFQIHRRLAASYRLNRVFLAGDAAHVHSPFGGQGANTGIQDAFNLAWKLALVLHGRAGERLLDTYEEERRPIAKEVLQGTHQLTSIFFQHNVFMRILRDRLIVPLLKQPAVQRQILWRASELGVHYHSSSLSFPQHRTLLDRLRATGKKLQAGDRAPDSHCIRLPGREETTLFQVFQNSQAHLLLFDGFVQNEAVYEKLMHLARRVEQLVRDEVQVHFVSSALLTLAWEGSLLYDSDHSIHARYGIHTAALAFIRPDGYVGLLSQPAQEHELVDYLQRIYRIASVDRAETENVLQTT